MPRQEFRQTIEISEGVNSKDAIKEQIRTKDRKLALYVSEDMLEILSSLLLKHSVVSVGEGRRFLQIPPINEVVRAALLSYYNTGLKTVEMPDPKTGKKEVKNATR